MRVVSRATSSSGCGVCSGPPCAWHRHTAIPHEVWVRFIELAGCYFGLKAAVHFVHRGPPDTVQAALFSDCFQEEVLLVEAGAAALFDAQGRAQPAAVCLALGCSSSATCVKLELCIRDYDFSDHAREFTDRQEFVWCFLEARRGGSSILAGQNCQDQSQAESRAMEFVIELAHFRSSKSSTVNGRAWWVRATPLGQAPMTLFGHFAAGGWLSRAVVGPAAMWPPSPPPAEEALASGGFEPLQ